MENVPVIQSARLEDYSPELWAATAGKGAAVLHMLRFVIGDENFLQTLKEFVTELRLEIGQHRRFQERWPRRSAGRTSDYFFIQWIESSGAPEFKLEYTVFRTQKGFRVMGKIAQDLDTFRMPVELKIETEGNPEEKRVEVVGHVVGVRRGYVRQAEEDHCSIRTTRCCATAIRCAWRSPSGAASSSPRSANSPRR